ERQVGEAELLVGADERPEVRLARVGPRVALPGVVPRFSRLRDDVEGPPRLAGADVERLHVARRLRAGLRRVGHLRAGHHDVAADLGTAARLVGGRARAEARLEMHATAGAPRGDRRAALRIDRDQVLAANREQPALAVA